MARRILLFLIVSIVSAAATLIVPPIDYIGLAVSMNSKKKVSVPSTIGTVLRRYVDPNYETAFVSLSPEQRVQLIDYMIAMVDAKTADQVTDYDVVADRVSADPVIVELYIKYLLGKKVMDSEANQELVSFSLSGIGHLHSESMRDRVDAIRQELVAKHPQDLQYLSLENMLDWLHYHAKPSYAMNPPKQIITDELEERDLRVMPTSWWRSLLTTIRGNEYDKYRPRVVSAARAIENDSDSDDDIQSISEHDSDNDEDRMTANILTKMSSATLLTTLGGKEVVIQESSVPFDDEYDEGAESDPFKESSDEEEEEEEEEEVAQVPVPRKRKRSPKNSVEPSPKSKTVVPNILSDGSVLIPARFKPGQVNHFKKREMPEGTVVPNAINYFYTNPSSMPLPTGPRRNLPELEDSVKHKIEEIARESQSGFLSDKVRDQLIAIDPTKADLILDFATYLMSLRHVDWELYQMLIEIASGKKPMQTPEEIVDEFKAKYPNKVSIEYLHPQDVYLAYSMYAARWSSNTRRPHALHMDIYNDRVIARMGPLGFAQGLNALRGYIYNMKPPTIEIQDDIPPPRSTPLIPFAPRPQISMPNVVIAPPPHHTGKLDESAFIVTYAKDIFRSGIIPVWSQMMSEIQNTLAYTSLEQYGVSPTSTLQEIEGIVLTALNLQEVSDQQIEPLVANFLMTITAENVLSSRLCLYNLFLQTVDLWGVLGMVTYRQFDRSVETILDLLNIPEPVYVAMSARGRLIDWTRGTNEGLAMFHSLTRFDIPANLMRQVTNPHIVFWMRYAIPRNLPTMQIVKYGVPVRSASLAAALRHAATAYLATMYPTT